MQWHNYNSPQAQKTLLMALVPEEHYLTSTIHTLVSCFWHIQIITAGKAVVTKVIAEPFIKNENKHIEGEDHHVGLTMTGFSEIVCRHVAYPCADCGSVIYGHSVYVVQA